MDKALIDTDILSEIMRGRNSRVLEHAATYSDEYRAFTVSVVTVAEIVKGLRKVSRALALERFIAELPKFEVLPIDTQVAILAGNMYAELERSGQPIGRADPMIAATASALGLVLVTGNVGHYARLPDLGFELRIANWRD